MDTMGWSNTSMAANYQHATAPIRDDVARRVDALPWGVVTEDDEGDDDGLTEALMPA